MATPTYDLLDSVTLASSAASVSFSSISQDYRDLVLVSEVFSSTTNTTIVNLRFNSSSSGYSWIYADGDGTNASSGNQQTVTSLLRISSGVAPLGANKTSFLTQILDYSATDKHKSVLSRGGNANVGVNVVAGRWSNTSAISSIQIFPAVPSLGAGSTFYLYGIAA